MHLAVSLITLAAAWRWADWNRWRQYYSTMLYMSYGNLLYDFLIQEHHLWEFHPDLNMNLAWVEVLYTFIVFPMTALIFLSRFPESGSCSKRFFHYVKWIAIYFTGETIGHWANRIDYHYGWSIWFSLLFDCMMFPMLRLHFKKTGLALILSAGLTILYMILFHIPFEHKSVD